MLKYLTLTSVLLLTACATAEETRIRNELQQACLQGANEQDRRVLLMNGVSGAALQTECIPYTHKPLPPKRFEGR